MTNSKGVLGNVKVRRALSLALNRRAIINSVHKGAALMPRWESNPGTFGYGRSVFIAEKLAAQQLPWIPTVQPDTVLLLSKGLTGAVSSSAYLFSPRADQLGGAG